MNPHYSKKGLIYYGISPPISNFQEKIQNRYPIVSGRISPMRKIEESRRVAVESSQVGGASAAQMALSGRHGGGGGETALLLLTLCWLLPLAIFHGHLKRVWRKIDATTTTIWAVG